MIERLNLEEVNNPGEATLKAFSILNQLVDAVNELQGHIKFLDERIRTKNFMVDIDKTNPISKYIDIEEQRKWIGKLCRFWNFKDGAVDIGILKAVDNLKPKIPYINDIDCSYAFCEPVKPDDPIIYKGGDND